MWAVGIIPVAPTGDWYVGVDGPTASCARLGAVIPAARTIDVPSDASRHAGESRHSRFYADGRLNDVDTGFRRHDEIGAAAESIVRAVGIRTPRQEPSMNAYKLVAIDTSKAVFTLHCIPDRKSVV